MNSTAVSAFKSCTAPAFKAAPTKHTEDLLPKESYDPAESPDEPTRDWGRSARNFGYSKNTDAVSAFKSCTAPDFKAAPPKHTEDLLPKENCDPAERQDEPTRDWGRSACVRLGALSLAPNMVQAKDVG